MFILVGFKVPIRLDCLKLVVPAAAGNHLDRRVVIEGGARIVLGLRPSLEVRGFRIASLAGWPGGGAVSVVDRGGDADLALAVAGFPAERLPEDGSDVYPCVGK
ncbi:MAG: hypothetical protein AAGD22_12975 [Verrucomicrobiota bacterium]